MHAYTYPALIVESSPKKVILYWDNIIRTNFILGQYNQLERPFSCGEVMVTNSISIYLEMDFLYSESTTHTRVQADTYQHTPTLDSTILKWPYYVQSCIYTHTTWTPRGVSHFAYTYCSPGNNYRIANKCNGNACLLIGWVFYRVHTYSI